jgi:anti-sigma B factor antagonist
MTAVSDPPSATVVLDGEIDIATAPAIRRFLMAALSGKDAHLAVDMSGVTFIGAAGIGVLVAAANRAREAGGGLSLLAPSPPVRRLLDVLHLDGVLPQPSAQLAPSLRAAPPDASPGQKHTHKVSRRTGCAEPNRRWPDVVPFAELRSGVNRHSSLRPAGTRRRLRG